MSPKDFIITQTVSAGSLICGGIASHMAFTKETPHERHRQAVYAIGFFIHAFITLTMTWLVYAKKNREAKS